MVFGGYSTRRLMNERQSARCRALALSKVYGELCTPRVLVQERFEGATASDTAALEALGFDRKALAEKLLRSAPRRSRYCVSGSSTPIPIRGTCSSWMMDRSALSISARWAALTRLIQQEVVVDMLAALVRRDVGLLRDGIERVADMSGAVSAERLERAIARVMTENMRPATQA